MCTVFVNYVDVILPTQDGQIDHKELQKCLTNSGSFNLYKQDQPFSLETCTLMINMLDTNYSGKMEFTEFKELMAVLNKWMVST